MDITFGRYSEELVGVGPPPSVIVFYVFVQPPVEIGKDKERRRVEIRRDVGEGLCREAQQKAFRVSTHGGKARVLAIGMSMLAVVLVRNGRSVLRNVLVLSTLRKAMGHKIESWGSKVKVGRRRTRMSARW